MGDGQTKLPIFIGPPPKKGPGLLSRSGLRHRSLWRGGLLRLRGRGGGLGLGRVLFRGGEDGVEDGAFHAGHELDHAGVADVLDEAIDDVVAKLAVGHLATAEAEAGLDLITVMEEADGLVLLGLVVVLVNGDGELDFFDDDDLLLLAGGALALILLVEVAAVVLDAADGRDGVGRNLDQIQAPLAGDFQGFKGWQDAELFAVFVDDANLACANAVVDADKGLGRTFVECDGAPPKVPRGPCLRLELAGVPVTRMHPEYSIGAVWDGRYAGTAERGVQTAASFGSGARWGAGAWANRAPSGVSA